MPAYYEHRCCAPAQLSFNRICPNCRAIADTIVAPVTLGDGLRLRITPDGPLISIGGPDMVGAPPAPRAVRRLAAPQQPPPPKASTPRPTGSKPHRAESRSAAPARTPRPADPARAARRASMMVVTLAVASAVGALWWAGAGLEPVVPVLISLGAILVVWLVR
jgi:hypothetical protein